MFGLFGDALADILRSKGIGPILKWVDDYIFFRIPRDTISWYNEQREANRQIIADNGGQLQTVGRLWFKGKTLADTGAEHFAEDFTFPSKSSYEHENRTFSYGINEIDQITAPLGIPWEKIKGRPIQLSDRLCRTLVGPRSKKSIPTRLKTRKIQQCDFRMAKPPHIHPRRNTQIVWKTSLYVSRHTTRQSISNYARKNDRNVP